MPEEYDSLNVVRETARKKVLYLPHAVRQMLRPDRMISREEVSAVLYGGSLIEDYPEDARGHSCLLLGFGDGNRPIHVVCSPKEDYWAAITAYIPDEGHWAKGFATRIRL